ncbi:MAG TPA: Spy/CpxP family protein refolding chaperone [Burkholderiaceae bacterium]
MKHPKSMLAAGALLACALPALAQMPPPPGAMGERGPHHGPRGPHGMPPLPNLTEAQQDRLFALRHAHEPARRALEKQHRHAMEALHALTGPYDEAKTAALARAAADAMAVLLVHDARARAEAEAVLTPEQRAQLRSGPRPPMPPGTPPPRRG